MNRNSHPSILVRILKELLPQNIMQFTKKFLFQRIKSQIQSFQQLSRVLIVHKQSIVKIEAIAACVLHQFQQCLIPFGINWGRLQIKYRQ